MQHYPVYLSTGRLFNDAATATAAWRYQLFYVLIPLSTEHYYKLLPLISGVLKFTHIGIIAALFYTKQ